MKKIIYIMAALCFLGCEGFLEKEPQDALTADGFYETANDATLAVNAAYSTFQNLNYYGFNFPVLSNISGGDAVKGGFGAGDRPSYLQFGSYEVNSGNLRAKEYFISAFGGVNRANQVLDNVTEMDLADDFPESLKNRILGEARFLRALNYYNLVLTFGGMPLVSSVPTVTDEPLPRASVQETWDFIIQDLEIAEGLLPATYHVDGERQNVGRATSGAANAMLARIHAFRGNWNDVRTYADAVINDTEGNYGLAGDYGSNFGSDGNNNVESIFEIQYTAGVTSVNVWSGPGGGGDWNSNQLSRYAHPQEQPAGAGGWAFMQPTQDLVDDYEAGDLRLPATVYQTGDAIGAEVFDPASTNHLANAGMFGLKKYTIPNDGNSGQGNAINYKIIRFAEVLLLKAEAENELVGPTAAALDPINLVRNRAGLLPIDATNNPGLDQTMLRDLIVHERRVELAMEGIRFFDLTQRGLAESELGSRGFSAGDEIFPIPSDELDLTGWDQN
ncbi:MAG: RagB/SusD family nutrient uptake outer membrane protein [Reichenbachiella sp.]